MTDQPRRVERARHDGARFRDDTKLGVVAVSPRWLTGCAPSGRTLPCSPSGVLDDPTLDDERRERVVIEVAEAAQVDEGTVLRGSRRTATTDCSDGQR